MKIIVEDLLTKYPLHNELFQRVTPAEKIGDREVETYILDDNKKKGLIEAEITNKKLSTTSFNYVLYPAPNVVDERIKAIVLYNGEVIRSNILTFTNSDPDVVSGATST